MISKPYLGWTCTKVNFSSILFQGRSVLERALLWHMWHHSVGGTSYPAPDNADVIDALADVGADVNQRFLEPPWLGVSAGMPPAEAQTTPLIWAVQNKRWKTVNVLLAHHVRIDATNWNGDTAMMAAADYAPADVVEALIRGGADVNAHRSNGDTVLELVLGFPDTRVSRVRAVVACLLRHGASVNPRTITAAGYWHDTQLIRMLKHANEAQLD
jgi:hypothetical protein